MLRRPNNSSEHSKEGNRRLISHQSVHNPALVLIPKEILNQQPMEKHLNKGQKPEEISCKKNKIVILSKL